MPALVRRLVRAGARRDPVLGFPLPGRTGRSMRNGALLAAAGTRRTRKTFDQWLTEQPPT